MTESENVVNDEKECSACGYALAGVGLIVGAIFFYMAIDIFSNGRVTALFTAGKDEE